MLAVRNKPKKYIGSFTLFRGIAMYKFMFFALVACAVYPDWPIEAMAAGQGLIENFQTKAIVVGQLSQ
jgi:hypothetical protein